MEALSDQAVRTLFQDIYNGFWLKWRHRVPAANSTEWEIIVSEAGRLMERYGHDERTDEMILWMLERLNERSKRIGQAGDERPD